MNGEWDDFIYDNFIEIFEEIAMNELIEDVAKKIAVANNGGDWAKHYNEDQKKIISSIKEIDVGDKINVLFKDVAGMH